MKCLFAPSFNIIICSFLINSFSLSQQQGMTLDMPLKQNSKGWESAECGRSAYTPPTGPFPNELNASIGEGMKMRVSCLFIHNKIKNPIKFSAMKREFFFFFR